MRSILVQRASDASVDETVVEETCAETCLGKTPRLGGGCEEG
jgi:hypothetical protein